MTSNQQIDPIITTIIPTYKRPRLLQRAMASVLNQTYPYFKICVYDNASGDDTASVVAAMARQDHRIKYHCHAENLGGIGNLIYGMEHVDTPFFSILADDDVLLPNFYHDALQLLAKYPTALFFGGNTLVLENDRIIGLNPKRLRTGFYEHPHGFRHLLRRHITWTSILFRSDVIKEIGVLHPDSGVWAEFDYEFRITSRFPLYYSAEPCSIWEYHPEYAHRKTAFYQNWQALLMLGGRLLNSDGISGEKRLRFFEWFLRNLAGATIQITENYPNGQERDRIGRDVADILRANKIQGVYGFITRNYIDAVMIISPTVPFLKFLKRSLKSLLSSITYQDRDDVLERRYRSLIQDVLNRT